MYKCDQDMVEDIFKSKLNCIQVSYLTHLTKKYMKREKHKKDKKKKKGKDETSNKECLSKKVKESQESVLAI